MSTTLRTLDDAIRHFLNALADHPERNALVAQEAACSGKRRRFPVLYMNHLADPRDTTVAVPLYAPPPHEFPGTPEGRLAAQILGLLQPLDMLNPVSAALSPRMGSSPADLVPSFGIPLSADGGAAAHTRPLADMVKLPPPDPEASGLMPTFREHIRFLRAHTPSDFKIRMPDMQGPFNLTHAMIGNDAFEAPLAEPEQFREFMRRVTDFWIAAWERLAAWIGPERRWSTDRWARLAECSVNMVSEDFYREHILPHDLRIARYFGSLWIHPCSGRHVFRATLQGLPGVAATEAGTMLSQMAAPFTPVSDALQMIGGRPILLSIGQELPEDPEAAFRTVCEDLDRYRDHPRLLYAYTGMFWRKKDRPMIRELHRRMDAYWESRAMGLGAG